MLRFLFLLPMCIFAASVMHPASQSYYTAFSGQSLDPFITSLSDAAAIDGSFLILWPEDPAGDAPYVITSTENHGL